MLGRGDRIKVGPEVVLSGQIWIGSEAVRIGIADETRHRNRCLQQSRRAGKGVKL